MIDYTNEIVIRTLRAQAWERAKGELQAILQTFWHQREPETFAEVDAAITAFIRKIEDEISL